MPEVSPAARALARQLLLHEAGEQPEPAALEEAADRAYVRLRERLAALIGLTGYTTLFARAVRLAQAEVPAMEHVTFNAAAGGDLHGVREFALANDPGATAAGLSAILDHVIGPLTTFIGKDLALRLVRESWPELAHGLDDAEERL